MADVSYPSLGVTDITALFPLQFVGGGSPMPVATLLSTYPATVSYVGMYGKVTDLWGSVRTVMVCDYDGNSYYWRPQRTDYAVSNASTGGAITLTPLLQAPVQFLTAPLASNMTITPSATNAWPGAQFTITSKGALSIFGITLSGLLGGALSILAGGTRTLTYTSAGWQGV